MDERTEQPSAEEVAAAFAAFFEQVGNWSEATLLSGLRTMDYVKVANWLDMLRDLLDRALDER